MFAATSSLWVLVFVPTRPLGTWALHSAARFFDPVTRCCVSCDQSSLRCFVAGMQSCPRVLHCTCALHVVHAWYPVCTRLNVTSQLAWHLPVYGTLQGRDCIDSPMGSHHHYTNALGLAVYPQLVAGALTGRPHLLKWPAAAAMWSTSSQSPSTSQSCVPTASPPPHSSCPGTACRHPACASPAAIHRRPNYEMCCNCRNIMTVHLQRHAL